MGWPATSAAPCGSGASGSSAPTNTSEKVEQTVIVGADAKNPEVLLVKGFFKDATVRADKRTDGSVDVLVGDQYGGFNKKAKTAYRGASRPRPACRRAPPPPRRSAAEHCGHSRTPDLLGAVAVGHAASSARRPPRPSSAQPLLGLAPFPPSG